MINNILRYFDSKNSQIKKYCELEKAIEDKKQEAQELAKSYISYKNDCEELIKGALLNKKPVQGVSFHVEERFNKYFVNYVNKLGEIKKSTEDFIGEKNKILSKYPELKQEIEKAEKQNTSSNKMKKVMGEFKNGELKSSSGEKVTDRQQAIAIAMSEAGLNKAEIDTAIVTIVKGYENGLISPSKFKELQKELSFYVELEKAEEVKMDKKDFIQEHEHLVEVLETGSKEEQKEEAKEQAEELIEIKEEPKETKSFADAVIKNNKGQILFLRRSKEDDFQPDKFGLVGGKIDKGETPEEACKREVKEETGLDVKNCIEIAQASKPEIHYFLVQIDDNGEIILENAEHKNYKWMCEEEWEKEDLIINLKDNLCKIFDINYNVKKL